MSWRQPDKEKQPQATSGRYYPYKELFLCKTCKFNITAYTKAKKLARTDTIAEYTFYTCTKKNRTIDCPEPQISASMLEQEIQARMAEFEISEANARECKDWVYQQYKAHVSKNGAFKDVWLADKAAAEHALNVLDEKLESGTITDDRYKLRSAVHHQTIEHADSMLNSTIRDAERWLELSNETFNSVVNLGEVFEMANDEERHKLMKYLGSNWYLSNKKVELTPRHPLDLLRHNDSDLVWRAVAFEIWNYFSANSNNISLLNHVAG